MAGFLFFFYLGRAIQPGRVILIAVHIHPEIQKENPSPTAQLQISLREGSRLIWNCALSTCQARGGHQHRGLGEHQYLGVIANCSEILNAVHSIGVFPSTHRT